MSKDIMMIVTMKELLESNGYSALPSFVNFAAETNAACSRGSVDTKQ